jgi:hypothetical protein
MSHELAELLLSRPNMPVLGASDEEGNSFNPLGDFSIELIEKGGEDSYDISLFSHEDLLVDYEEDEIATNFREVLVLWP